jgi:hypothetical protein
LAVVEQRKLIFGISLEIGIFPRTGWRPAPLFLAVRFLPMMILLIPIVLLPLLTLSALELVRRVLLMRKVVPVGSLLLTLVKIMLILPRGRRPTQRHL